jgi:hypothetical protein
MKLSLEGNVIIFYNSILIDDGRNEQNPKALNI